MTISIDCRMLYASGIGVYLRECLPYFLESENRFLLFGDSEKILPFVKDRENAELIHYTTNPFSPGELLSFPPTLRRKINQTDLYYSPFFNIPGGIKVPVYTTIHDMVFPDIPGLVSPLGLAVRMLFYHRAFKLSDKLFTVSEFSRGRVIHYAKKNIPVVVTHSAIQPYLLDLRRENAQKENSVIFIGNIKKHKGLSLLVDAFTEVAGEGLTYKLIIVGSRENFRSSDREFSQKISGMAAGLVEFTGSISNENLADLLAKAKLLVQPSFYEGFGLPPLEAMVLGTPALISDIPVFREIYKDYPVSFFRSGDKEDLRKKMTELLVKPKTGNIFLSKELTFRYTFKKTASIILKEFTC